MSAFTKDDIHYRLIKKFYGDKRAQRSQVPYINHIDEGIKILDSINASYWSYAGYCLHPIFQSDSELLDTVQRFDTVIPIEIPHKSIVFAMEYRRVANSYLSHNFVSDLASSPLKEVWEMLTADKVQNRKDFEIYHKGTHPRSDELDEYFKNWMKILCITEEHYQQLAKLIS